MMDDGDEINEFFDNESYEDEPMVEKDNELNDLIEKENKNVKKTVKCRPQPKLNEATLMGPKGIQALRDSFKSFKPDLTKDPYDNLDVMLEKYEYWAHCMFPKLKFEDVVSRCEHLGEKRAIKVYMTKSRLDMPLTDEDFAKPRRSNRDEIIETENNEDNFAPTNRQSGSDDDENFYNKIRFPTSYGKNKEGSISNKSVLPLTNISHVNCSPEMENDIIESALEARAVAMQKEFSRREEEELAMADEIMADFDI